MNANTKEALTAAYDATTGIIAPGKVMPLHSNFNSLSDALHSYHNSRGYGKEKALNASAVINFCEALGIPSISGNTDELLSGAQYFESALWFFEYVEKTNMIRMGNGEFFLLDNGNRPIFRIDLSNDASHNLTLKFSGSEEKCVEFMDLVKQNVKIDPNVENKTKYMEVVPATGMSSMMGSKLTLDTHTIDNPRVAKPEYYPYLDGGAEALISSFIESEESVLVLMGPPGGGKSSLIAAATDSLNLLPIYAKRAEVIHDKEFLNYVFKISDNYMEKIGGAKARSRSELFVDRMQKDKEFPHYKSFHNNGDNLEHKIPVIIVEDAHLLLAPRSAGNLMMAELLNATDGIGSNHTRKIIFTTNLTNVRDIDEALLRPGRCYDVVHCRLLSPAEAVAARAANELPPFEVVPTKDISLAEALRKPRKRICISNGKASLGFTDKQ